jgi:hypothetical protein
MDYSSNNQLHNGSIIYDRTWAPWLRTSPGVAINSITRFHREKTGIKPFIKIELKLPELLDF